MSKYLIEDRGEGLPCRISEFKGDNSFQPAANQLVVNKSDLPSCLPDYWSIVNGALVSDDKPGKIKDIKKQRDLDMNDITVMHNSKNWSFNRENRADFDMKISRDRNFDWKADDGTVVELTPAVAENIAKKVDDAMTQIFFDAEAAISQL